MKRKLITFLSEALCLFTAIITGIKVFEFLSPLAAAERGYTGAVGGELLAAVAVGIAVYYIIGAIADLLSDLLSKGDENNGER